MKFKTLTLLSTLVAPSIFFVSCGEKEKITYDDFVTNKDIEYKSNKKLDILRPTKKIYDKSPAIIFLHGGSWVAGNKSGLFSNYLNVHAKSLLNNGYTLISAQYTLLNGKNIFPINIKDAKDVVRWTYKNADQYNIDTNNIGGFGFSSGAHLSLMSAYSSDNDYLDDDDLKEYSSKLNYLINYAAPIDIAKIYDFEDYDNLPDSEKAMIKFFVKQLFNIDFGDNLSEDIKLETLQEANKYRPYKLVDENTVPTITFHGTTDITVPFDQALLLDQAFEDANNNNHTLYKVEGGDHGFGNIPLDQINEIDDALIKFVNNQYI